MIRGPAASSKRLVFRTFGALPKPIRRQLIRTLRPSWTAGALAIIQRDDGRWLFVKPVYRRGWTLPGGLVDRRESPEVTIVREVKEELGISVVITDGPWTILDPEHFRVEVVFRAVLEAGIDPDSVVVTSAELSGLGWHDPEDPPDLEDETVEVLTLANDVAAGGSHVRIQGDIDKG